MELVFIGPVLLPITPEKIDTGKPGANNTTRLINDGEINILHKVGLRTFAFDVILPSSQSYPFQIYKLDGLEATAFTTYFDELQKQKVPFPFIQVTWNNALQRTPSGNLKIAYTNVLCTIEEQQVSRDSINGTDYVVSLTLKEFKEYGTKYVSVTSNDSRNVAYNVVKNTTNFTSVSGLQSISKQITDNLGAVAGAAISSFYMAQDTARKTESQSNNIIGW